MTGSGLLLLVLFPVLPFTTAPAILSSC